MKPTIHPLHFLGAAPRAHLFTTYRLSILTPTRHLSTTPSLQKDSSPFSFKGMPMPPRLPKEDQEVFESLQRQSTGAFSTPLPERRTPPRINQSPDSSGDEVESAQSVVDERIDRIASSSAKSSDEVATAAEGEKPTILKDMYDKVIEAKGKGEELHPNVRRGATPEFQGDVNPKTGEVGGPKNEPLRWGAAGEWTYNGRATDF